MRDALRKTESQPKQMIFYLAYTSPANSKFLATYLRLLDVSLLSGRLNILYIFQITMR